jgi:hypothetical protein
VGGHVSTKFTVYASQLKVEVLKTSMTKPVTL